MVYIYKISQPEINLQFKTVLGTAMINNCGKLK